MKIDEMIKSLEYMKKAYGNLDVILELGDDKNLLQSQDKEVITFGYEQFEDKDMISIRNFPY